MLRVLYCASLSVEQPWLKTVPLCCTSQTPTGHSVVPPRSISLTNVNTLYPSVSASIPFSEVMFCLSVQRVYVLVYLISAVLHEWVDVSLCAVKLNRLSEKYNSLCFSKYFTPSGIPPSRAFVCACVCTQCGRRFSLKRLDLKLQ